MIRVLGTAIPRNNVSFSLVTLIKSLSSFTKYLSGDIFLSFLNFITVDQKVSFLEHKSVL